MYVCSFENSLVVARVWCGMRARAECRSLVDRSIRIATASYEFVCPRLDRLHSRYSRINININVSRIIIYLHNKNIVLLNMSVLIELAAGCRLAPKGLDFRPSIS